MTTNTPDKPDACPYCGSPRIFLRTPLCRALERASKAEAELAAIRSGHQGCCYACEPVAILNKKLEAELAEVKMKLEVNEVLNEIQELENQLRKLDPNF